MLKQCIPPTYRGITLKRADAEPHDNERGRWELFHGSDGEDYERLSRKDGRVKWFRLEG